MDRKPDTPLLSARRRLDHAVRALADPQPVFDGLTHRWSDPVYERLRGSLRGQPTRQGRRMPTSRPPCHTAILALLIEVDMTAAEWEKHGPTTLERLRQSAARDRRPEDRELVEDMAAQVEAWTLKAVELLGDKPPEVALRMPCPSCGTRFVYRPSNGENVRAWALRVSEDGARCQSCEATWAPEQFEFLAKLLGCPSLPA